MRTFEKCGFEGKLIFEEKNAISGMATNCGISGRFSRGLRGHP
jgi:hypothetical protein